MFPMNERMIGANIRSLRLKAGLTIFELAKKSDLTKGALSKIENGQSSPPISTLMRIAEGIELPLAMFFVATDEDPSYTLTRKGAGRVVTRDGSRYGYCYEALAMEMRQKYVEPFILTVNPKDPVARFHHWGQEFVYVLVGRLEFTIGEETLKLAPGDSLFFDSAQVHSFRALGKPPARFLCVFIQEIPKPGAKGQAPAARIGAQR